MSAPYLLAEETVALIKQRRCLVEKVLVRIGRVTAAANHHFVEVEVDGVLKRTIRRDTLPPPKPKPKPRPLHANLRTLLIML